MRFNYSLLALLGITLTTATIQTPREVISYTISQRGTPEPMSKEAIAWSRKQRDLGFEKRVVGSSLDARVIPTSPKFDAAASVCRAVGGTAYLACNAFVSSSNLCRVAAGIASAGAIADALMKCQKAWDAHVADQKKAEDAKKATAAAPGDVELGNTAPKPAPARPAGQTGTWNPVTGKWDPVASGSKPVVPTKPDTLKSNPVKAAKAAKAD